MPEHFDVLIIGAGLSGIDAAWHLQKYCPRKTYAILEQRERIGGTWDLFRYPGIRSDSDMFTMAYSFRPWTKPKAISPGEDIREYITDTAREAGITAHIRFRHSVKRANWSSDDCQWHIAVARALPNGDLEDVTLTCNFVFFCSGYYRYSSGYLPEFRDIGKFQGRVIHPQAWPEDLDFTGKRIVIIGSGATAVTLLPAIAQTAAHVTMLQRSPTYIVSLPQQDRVADALRKALPAAWASHLNRWKNMFFSMYVYNLAQAFPNYVKTGILKQARQSVGPNCDAGTHFSPGYNPWQQRLCLIPDGDLFKVIRDGRASVVTAQIQSFTESGIQLESGQLLPADVVVTATGLVLQTFGGAQLTIDGQPVDLANTLSYKGVMYSGVPNLATVFGYINASWTLKADLICRFVCRLLNFMDKKKARQVTPQPHGEKPSAPFVENFSSGYIQRSIAGLPKTRVAAPVACQSELFERSPRPPLVLLE